MMEFKIGIQDVPVKDIIFDEENPNWHSEEDVQAMAKSIGNLFRLHDPLGYYDDGKCRLILGELRVRAEIRNGATTIKGMKLLLEKPTERLIRELQATENIQRRLDWVSRAETYLKLQETGMSSKEIQDLISLEAATTIQTLTRVARLLRKLRPEIVEVLRESDAHREAAVEITGIVGTRTKIGVAPGRQIEVITDEDAAITEAVLQKLLQGEISREEARGATLELKVGGLEELLEKEQEEREAEVQELLQKREQTLKVELEKQQEAKLKKKKQELESHYQQLLRDRDRNIEALEAKFKQVDKKEVEAVAKLRKDLEEEREAKKALQEGLKEEQEKLREEIESEFQDSQARLIKAEGEKIRKQIEQGLAEREAKLREEERRLELERERLTKVRRDLEASREKLKDVSARAHHIAKELIAQRAELSAMVIRAADERFLDLLEKEEKLQLLRSFKDGVMDDLRLIQHLGQEVGGESPDELRKLVSEIKD